MALQDCIKKLGVVSREDRELLQQFLDEGLTDEQAVRRLLIQSQANVIDIAGRAREAGAVVAGPRDVIGELRSFQNERLQRLLVERAGIEDQIAESNADYGDMAGNVELMNEKIASILGSPVKLEEASNEELEMLLGQAMFNPELRGGLRRGVLGVQGATPKEVVDSFIAYRDAMRINRRKHGGLINQYNRVAGEVDRIMSGETYYQEVEGIAPDYMGFFSSLEKAVVEMSLPEWKKGGEAKGKVIAQKIRKMQGVKKEEIEWTGLLDLLDSAPEEKFSRDQIRRFVQANGVELDETVTDPNLADSVEELEWDDGTVWDVDEAWEGRAEDLLYEFDQAYPPTGPEDPYLFFSIEGWFETRHDDIVEDYDLDEDQIARLDGTMDTLAEVLADNKYDLFEDYEKDIRDDAESSANETAYNDYMDDPLYIYEAYGNGVDMELYIFGNNDLGYDVRDGGTDYRDRISGFDEPVYSLSEAQIRAEEYAREQGYLRDEESEFAPRWSEYVEGSFTNYREVKLKLPEMEATFIEPAHFGDEENIVMFMRVTDRMIPNKALWIRTVGAPLDFDPAALGLRELSPAEARFNHEQGSTIIIGRKTADSDGNVRGYNLQPTRPDMTDTLSNLFFGEDRAEHRGERYFIVSEAGNRVSTYFIDEAQSDWHQQGREYGYADYKRDQELRDEVGRYTEQRYMAAEELVDEFKQYLEDNPQLPGLDVTGLVDAGEGPPILNLLSVDRVSHMMDKILEGSEVSDFRGQLQPFAKWLIEMHDGVSFEVGRKPVPTSRQFERFVDASNGLDQAKAEQQRRQRSVPDAPFKGDAWLALGLKRALVQAIEEGNDQFAWADSTTLSNRWSSRYTEMYENQYDKKMPSIIRKLTGQKPEHLAPDGAPARQGENGYWKISLTPELKEKIKTEGFPLFQDKRGSITFNEAGRATINLYEAADLSTFIHEAGHLYLNLLKMLSSRREASERILGMAETVLKELGVESFDEITVEHHERWAEWFEGYAMTGKAPTPALQRAFNSFRVWLLEVYRKLRGIKGFEVPDEIRNVMDRMLASDEEIAAAEANMDYAPIYVNAEQAAMTDREFELYKTQIIEAHNDEVAKQSSKLMEAMKRDQKAWWNEEYKQIEAQIRLWAYEQKVFNARAFLMTGKLANGLPSGKAPFKLDRESVLKALNGDAELMKKLPHTGSYGVYRRKGGVDVDVAAQWLGYTDGLELLNDLLNAPDMETWIAATTNERMKQKYPDPFKDGSMQGAAIRAVHSTKRAAIIAAEMRQLRKQMRENRPVVRATEERIKQQRREAMAANKGQLPKRDEIQMIRRAAAERIERMRIRDVKPHVFLNAERKAAREAFAAMERQDFEKAYEAKRRQLINFEMYRAAVKVGEENQKTRRYLSKFENKRVQQRLGKGGVLNKILGILDGIDIRKRSLAEVDRLEAMKDLKDWVDSGRMIVTPETLALVESKDVNWQNLTVEQFRGLKELVQQLEHEADRTEYVYLNDEKLRFDDIVVELEQSILENGKEIELRGGSKSKAEGMAKVGRQALTVWLRPGAMARLLDRNGWGSMTKRFIAPVRRAYAEKYIPRIHDMQEKLAKIYLNHFSFKEMSGLYKRTIAVPGHGKKYSRADALSLALNMGNEGNIKAVNQSMANGKIIYDKVFQDTLLGTLTESDWQFVQATWDYMESFYPELKAAEERRRGVAPEQVKAKPLTVRTADGKTVTLRGGYFPIAFDPDLSDRVKQDEVVDIMEKMGTGVYVSASTRASSTYERVQNHGLPVRLNLNVIDIHLRDVIRDLSLGDEVNAIQRVINDKRFRSAMRQTNNMETLKVLNLWLTDSAVGESAANHIVTKSARWIRGGFVKAKLGLSATVSLLQFTGWFQSAATIGSTVLAKGVGEFAKKPMFWWTHVPEMSPFIKARYDIGAWNRDVQDVQAHINSFFGVVPTMGKRAFNLIGASLFLPIKYAQKAVDITTWLAGYHDAVNTKNMPQDEAILYADAMVENAQTSGFFSDRSALERGTLSQDIRQAEYVRIWTTLIGYMLAKGNIAYEKTSNTNFKDPKHILAWALDMVLLFTIEGMASAIIYGNWPEEDDETGEREYAKWLLSTTTDSVISGVPFLREIPQQRYGSGSTPLGALFKDTLELYDQAGQGEVDEVFVKRVIDLAGYTHLVPSAQINRTLQAIWDEDDTSLLEYATGPRDKE